MKAIVHDMSEKGCTACGFIGIGTDPDFPAVTIYFGITQKHQTFAEAEQLAHKILQVVNDHAR